MSSIAPRFRFTSAVCLFMTAIGALAQNKPPQHLEVCEACHGPTGISQNPLVPTLAGQPFSLIEDNLLAFRSGLRSCAAERMDASQSANLAQAMCAQVRDLSGEEISALAEYFEGQEFVPARQKFDAKAALEGREVHQNYGCDQCHSDGGRTSNSMAPVLAGQWAPYLRRSLDALRSGKKKGPREMNASIALLSDEQIEALIQFYASREAH